MNQGRKPKRVRRFTLTRLRERPVEIPTCSGRLILSASVVAGRVHVCLDGPEEKPPPQVLKP